MVPWRAKRLRLTRSLSCALLIAQAGYVGTGAYNKNIAMSMAMDMVAYEDALAERKARSLCCTVHSRTHGPS